MAGILIIAHAPLATALQAVARHVYPDCASNLAALDVTPEMTAEVAEVQARVLLKAVPHPETLILTDVFGATPCNVAARLADRASVRVVAGVNVPMLWRCLCYANESIDAMAARAVAGAAQGVMQVASTRPQNQTLKPGTNDQDHRHHQQ